MGSRWLARRRSGRLVFRLGRTRDAAWTRAAVVLAATGLVAAALVLGPLAVGCFPAATPDPAAGPPPSRLDSIPSSAVKMTPAGDPFRPVVHLAGWEAAIPLPGPITTAGSEDSPFVTPDGGEFYFFFTPDLNIPAQEQLMDGVTGLWVARAGGEGGWTEPERVILCDDIALDGCEVVQGDTLWFASVRVGNMGEIDVYTATRRDGKWARWRNAGSRLNQALDVGEFHVTPEGDTLFFHSYREGGLGGLDIWVTRQEDGDWGDPVNLGPGVNSAADEGWPFLSPDGGELWFCGTSRKGYAGPAVFRSTCDTSGAWGPAVEVVSNFAGEPCLDARGNLYFVHHYFDAGGKMIEADIYVAYRK